MIEGILPICIQPATPEDVPEVINMVNSKPDALVPVKEDQILSWIDKGHSLVGKTKSGLLVAHQALTVWKESGYLEGRSAIVKPAFRGMGIGTLMKHAIDALAEVKYSGQPIISFTEAGSEIRGIVQKMGYKEIPLVEAHPEFFAICPENCVLKTGIDCGCKIYLKQPEQ